MPTVVLLRQVLLALVLCAAGGCSPSPIRDVGGDEVTLIRRIAQGEQVDLQALIFGRLWLVGRCVTIGKTADDSRTTIWRSGYRVGEDDKGMFIYHPDGRSRFRFGDEVRFGGGYIETLDAQFVTTRIEGRSLRDCRAPFVFVDATELN